MSEDDDEQRAIGAARRYTQNRTTAGSPLAQARPSRRRLRDGGRDEHPTSWYVRGATQDIVLLFYFPYVTPRFSFEDLKRYLWFDSEDPTDPANNRLVKAGINLRWVTDARIGALKRDLKAALDRPAAIVLYMGHARLAGRLGLVTVRGRSEPDITYGDVARLVANARAKALIIAGCSSNDMPRTKGDTVVVTTDSGPDYVTESGHWWFALQDFFDVLLASPPPSIADCVRAANRKFQQAGLEDRFVVAGGDGTMTRAGSPERGDGFK